MIYQRHLSAAETDADVVVVEPRGDQPMPHAAPWIAAPEKLWSDAWRWLDTWTRFHVDA